MHNCQKKADKDCINLFGMEPVQINSITPSLNLAPTPLQHKK